MMGLFSCFMKRTTYINIKERQLFRKPKQFSAIVELYIFEQFYKLEFSRIGI